MKKKNDWIENIDGGLVPWIGIGFASVVILIALAAMYL